MEENIPRSAKICREHNVEAICTAILGTCVGHLIDLGLNDLEVLTIVEDLLKMRAMLNDPAMLASLKKIESGVPKHLKEGA